MADGRAQPQWLVGSDGSPRVPTWVLGTARLAPCPLHKEAWPVVCRGLLFPLPDHAKAPGRRDHATRQATRAQRGVTPNTPASAGSGRVRLLAARPALLAATPGLRARCGSAGRLFPGPGTRYSSGSAARGGALWAWNDALVSPLPSLTRAPGAATRPLCTLGTRPAGPRPRGLSRQWVRPTCRQPREAVREGRSALPCAEHRGAGRTSSPRAPPRSMCVL